MVQEEQQQKVIWVECKVSRGMFSDERLVEVFGRSVFVDDCYLRQEDGKDLVQVTVTRKDDGLWATIPTSTRESVPMPA